MKTLIAFLVLLPVLAFAAPDGGAHATPSVVVAASPVALPTVTVTPPSAPSDILQGLLSAFQTHNWTLLAALLLIGTVAFLRWWAPKVHGKTGAWLNTNRGGTSLVLVCGVLGAVGTALYGGARISAQVVLAGVTVGVLASGGWNTLWDIFAPNDKKADLSGPVPMVSPTVPPETPKAA